MPRRRVISGDIFQGKNAFYEAGSTAVLTLLLNLLLQIADKDLRIHHK